jgi:hypothetical protein
MEFTFDIIGDSHLARLEAAGARLPIDGSVDLWTRKGGGIEYLEYMVEEIDWDMFGRFPKLASDITIIFLGGNDLDVDTCVPHRLADRFGRAIRKLVELDSIVFVMAQWPRPGARIGALNYWTNVGIFEGLLAKQLPEGCQVWDWDDQLRTNAYFFSRDGVHCVAQRHKKVGRYLASAAVAAARQLRRLMHT